MIDWIWKVREEEESGQFLMLVLFIEMRKTGVGQESRVIFWSF